MKRVLMLFILPLAYIFTSGFYLLLQNVPQTKFLTIFYIPLALMHLPGLLVLEPYVALEIAFAVNLLFYIVLNLIIAVPILYIISKKRTK